jgi:DNA modification methylase
MPIPLWLHMGDRQHWVGKRPLRSVTAYPAQHVETFDPERRLAQKPGEPELWRDWPKAYPKGGLLFHGDNKEVLAHLLANGFRGKVNLIYIDPPFDSGADYVRKVSLRGPKGIAKLDGETYTLGEQLQYTDIWANDNYLQFMYERLLLLKELMSDDGSIFLHCDWHKHHHLRCLLDEVFGFSAFRNEIVVKRGRRKNLQSQFDTIDALGAETDSILLFQRTGDTQLNKVESSIRATGAKWKDFWRGNVDRPSMRYEIPVLGFPQPARGQLLWKKERGLRAAENYSGFQRSGESELEAYWRKTREGYRQKYGTELEFVSWDGEHIIKYWIPPKEQGIIGNLWADIEAYSYKHDFKTEKHESLLTRIMEMASHEGDLVLDCFLGSGTTVSVAQQLGRRWIGCDINKGAIQTTAKRLMRVLEVQRAEEPKREEKGRQKTIEGLEAAGEGARPLQWGFTVSRINDYDLAVKTTEAIGLACEHLGVQRTRTDRFFDGTLGKRLVKIVPFDHPLTPLDLDELRKELDARPEEDRDIVVAALGCEIAARAWVEGWNRLRKNPGAANRIEILELRSDPRVGGFFTHQPASANVKIEREKARLVVEILDFVSPSILERLKGQSKIVKPLVEDFRSMIDWIEIDTDYDGKVFNVALVDLPERKQELIAGRYELASPKKGSTVAVKIVDMLGEEVLVTAKP